MYSGTGTHACVLFRPNNSLWHKGALVMGFVGLWIFILGFVTLVLGQLHIEITGAARRLPVSQARWRHRTSIRASQHLAGATYRSNGAPFTTGRPWVH